MPAPSPRMAQVSRWPARSPMPMPTKSGPTTIRSSDSSWPMHHHPGTGRCVPQGEGYRRCMRCPTCTSLDDKVVDSRLADDGVAIRRRRECLGCGRRFTTFERIEELALVVVKRSGVREPFRRTKVVAGVRAAAKNRPVSPEQLEGLAADVEE